MSGDGHIALGNYWLVQGGDGTPFRRVGNGPIEPLSPPPTATSGWATCINADGQVAAGYSVFPSGETRIRAFRWTPERGSVILPFPSVPSATASFANAISADGQTLAGDLTTIPDLGAGVAVRWRNGGATVEVLPGIAPNEPDTATTARAISSDGRFVTGTSSVPGRGSSAVRWNDLGELTLVGTASGHGPLVPWAISADGTMIAGYAGIGSGYEAVIWTELAGGMVLADYLSERGVVIPEGWRLERCYAMTADGLSFGGSAVEIATNHHEAFVATVPGAPTLWFAALCVPCCARRSRRGD